MYENDNNDNVIEFPKVNRYYAQKEAETAASMIDGMQRTKAYEMSNYLAESIMMAGAKEFAS